MLLWRYFWSLFEEKSQQILENLSQRYFSLYYRSKHLQTQPLQKRHPTGRKSCFVIHSERKDRSQTVASKRVQMKSNVSVFEAAADRLKKCWCILLVSPKKHTDVIKNILHLYKPHSRRSSSTTWWCNIKGCVYGPEQPGHSRCGVVELYQCLFLLLWCCPFIWGKKVSNRNKGVNMAWSEKFFRSWEVLSSASVFVNISDTTNNLSVVICTLKELFQ